jgi:hypothetical protein
MHKATEAATEAAKQNVEIARLTMRATRFAAIVAEKSVSVQEMALDIERPYLFVEKQTIKMTLGPSSLAGPIDIHDVTNNPWDFKGSEDRYPFVDFSFELRNRGKGVALVRNVRVRMVISDGLFNKTKRITIGRGEARFHQRIIGPGDHQSGSVYNWKSKLTIELLERITKLDFALTFILLIRYADVFKRQSTAILPFIYKPPMQKNDGSLLYPAFLTPAPERYTKYF